MAKIAFCGLGKLGLPIALSVARHHDVVGYDVSPEPRRYLTERTYPHREDGVEDYLRTTTLRIADTVDAAVTHADAVFVVVQTPHRPEFEGVTRLPDERADFDYTYLKDAVRAVATAAAAQRKRIALVVMSTVLPGTMDREIRPLLNPWTALVYNPAFPAMGTVLNDFEHPEFALIGVDDRDAADSVRTIYEAMIDAPVVEMSVRSAEATKVFYNSFISAKIGLSNAWMEVCHRLGANVDDVSRALGMANKRITSSYYMNGGMGDGGGCLTPGTLVYTERGARPVSAIWPGDRVLASDGTYRAVTETYKRPYKGQVLAVKVRGLPPGRFTPDHPFSSVHDLRGVLCGADHFHARWLTAYHSVFLPKCASLDLPPGHHRIESIDCEEYEGTVWNLNVEGTHDYVTSAGTVKNCHPRDNIALSWLSRKLGMGYDLFGDLMRIREKQTEWLAGLVRDHAARYNLPVVVLGKAYKAETNLTVGSCATLLKGMLDESLAGVSTAMSVIQWDPHVDGPRTFDWPATFVVATDHPEFYAMEFAPGSVVIDPWGRMPDRNGVEVVRVGRHREEQAAGMAVAVGERR